MSKYWTPPVIDPRDCDHPDRSLRYDDGHGTFGYRHYRYYGKQAQRNRQPSMRCLKCNSVVVYVQDETEFCKQRAFKFESATGLDASLYRDMLGNEIQIGSLIVYPRPGHTMGTGAVEAINHTKSITDWDRAQLPRVDAPSRIKVAPSEWNSRDLIPYTSRRADGTPKSITLVQGAPSAVVIG